MDFFNIKAEDFMREALEKSFKVRIYYFATTSYKNKIENLEIQDTLTTLFMEDNIITTETGAIIQIDEVDFDVTDGVLEMDFEVMVSNDYNKVDNSEYMIDLEFNLEKESE